jgi:hypothetical protein
MTNSSDSQIKTAASRPTNTKPDAASQDQMWKKFDAMLQEFLKMEQTSPAAETHKPVKTTA